MTPCRSCAHTEVDVVLDLGVQPSADRYPLPGEPVTVSPLRLGCCRSCGLAQLLEDPGHREEPLGVEPAALREQAADAVSRLVADGVVAPGTTFVEYDSPHGGGWRELLTAAGALDRTDDPPAGGVDLVVDVFGVMHEPDQAAAFAERRQRLHPGGTLALQYQPLERIVELGQWNAVRHAHFAYFATGPLRTLLTRVGLRPGREHHFELYGGTTLLTATIGPADDLARPAGVDLTPLVRAATHSTRDLRDWLTAQRSAGQRVVGYGAASRTTPLLNAAGIGPDLLPLVVDAAPGKHGRVIPGVGVPIGDPAGLRTDPPDVVLLFLADLLTEVRRGFPEVEASGARWAVADPAVRLVPRVGETTELAT